MDWTEVEIETVKEMWEARCSAGQISAVIKRTRSAILGKIHRIGLSFKGGSPTATRNNRKPSTRPKVITIKPPSPAAVTKAEASDYDQTALRLSLFDLPANGCHWPVDYADQHLFCGHEKQDGKPYCAHHAARGVRTKEGVII